MSTGYQMPGSEMEATSQAAALAAAASEPVAWTPPPEFSAAGHPSAESAIAQPASFNPRLSMPRPVPVPPQAQPYAQAIPNAPQAYAPPMQPDHALVPPAPAQAPTASFATMMGQAPMASADPYADPYAASPYGAPPAYDIPQSVEAAPAKTSLLSRFKRKPKTASRGGIIAAASVVEVTDPAPAAPGSSGKPFVMGVLTGIAMMLGIGFMLGGEPDPIPARYAPAPMADTAEPTDAPLAFMDMEEVG